MRRLLLFFGGGGGGGGGGGEGWGAYWNNYGIHSSGRLDMYDESCSSSNKSVSFFFLLEMF